MAGTKGKTMKSLMLADELIKKIAEKAKSKKRSSHYLMVEALEKAFK